MSITKEQAYVRRNRLMVNCDEAAYLSSKGEIDKLPFSQRIKLQMHLMACKNCKNYAKQIRLISRSISRRAGNVDKEVFSQKLSAIDKSNLSEVINSKMG